MLQQVMEFIHNYFISDSNRATYTIADGNISPVFIIKENQRFMIAGSDLNDGVYTWRSAGIYNDDNSEVAGLQDETFAGTICALAVPPQVIALSEEINDWVEKYADVTESPFASESFNGYSYSYVSGGTQGGGASQVGWQNVFGKRLERWRRPCL